MGLYQACRRVHNDACMHSQWCQAATARMCDLIKEDIVVLIVGSLGGRLVFHDLVTELLMSCIVSGKEHFYCVRT